MKTKIKSLTPVAECIDYVKSLGYTFNGHSYFGYQFHIIDPSRRPAHNHNMTWSLAEMRWAVKNGC
jgi:hypothetical protein